MDYADLSFRSYFLLFATCASMCHHVQSGRVDNKQCCGGASYQASLGDCPQGPSMHAETMLWGLDERLQALKGVGCNLQGVR